MFMNTFTIPCADISVEQETVSGLGEYTAEDQIHTALKAAEPHIDKRALVRILLTSYTSQCR